MSLFSRRLLLAVLGGAGMTGLARRPAGADDRYDDPQSLYRALADQPGERIDFEGGSIGLVFADGAPGLDRTQVRLWVGMAARAIATYFGHFPIKHYGLLIITEDSDTVGHGTTFGFAGSATRIHVGRDAAPKAFRDDWILVHEMMHASLPDLPRRALWLQEGNATWLEPIARAQAGELPISDVWSQSLRGMPRGEPMPEEGGMDGTDRWGRLYWGGATFWLEAEVAIWEQSGGRASLVDAMRAVSAASGGNIVTWQPEQMMAVGDRGCGVTALAPLYRRFSQDRVATDLGKLFERLGIRSAADGTVTFDPRAELAALAARITRPEAFTKKV